MAEALEDGISEDPDRYHKQMQLEVTGCPGITRPRKTMGRGHASSGSSSSADPTKSSSWRTWLALLVALTVAPDPVGLASRPWQRTVSEKRATALLAIRCGSVSLPPSPLALPV
jgi:hypothetical protein